MDLRRAAVLVGVGGSIRMVPPAEVEAAIGYPALAFPPVAHEPRPRAVVVDAGVVALERVYAGGGEVDAMLEIAPADIVRLAGAGGLLPRPRRGPAGPSGGEPRRGIDPIPARKRFDLGARG